MTVNSDSDQLLVEYCEKLGSMLDNIWGLVKGPKLATQQVRSAPEILKSSEELASLARSSSHSLVRETLPWLALFPETLLGAFGGYELFELDPEYGWKRLYDACYDRLVLLQGKMREEIASRSGELPLTGLAQQVHETIIDGNKEGKPITGPSMDRTRVAPGPHPNLSRSTRRVYMHLKEVEMPATYDDITHALQMGRSTCAKALDELDTLGMIQRMPGGGALLAEEYRHAHRSEED